MEDGHPKHRSMTALPFRDTGPRARVVRAGACVPLLAVVALFTSQCAKSGETDRDASADGPGGGISLGGGAPAIVGDASAVSVGDASSSGTLTIVPPDAIVTVSIQDGVVTAAPSVMLTAQTPSGPVPASWSIDRGELGAIDASGLFRPSGSVAGAGTVRAAFGSLSGATSVTVRIVATRNGGPTWSGDAGAGGYGGVGGEGPGGAADPTVFAGAAATPSSAQELGFVYPYDGTVWPRGLLAPLLQWQTTHVAQAVYVHLSQHDYDFKGYYGLTQVAAGAARMRQPLDAQAWDQATHSNEGDPLHVEVTVASSDGVFGPIAESWPIAPAILQGTVYYGSYNTALNGNPGTVTGAVLSIQPGNPSPSLAVPSLKGACHACHEVSANGSTLYTNDAIGDYAFGGSYDLGNGSALIKGYDQTDVGVGGLQYGDVAGKFTYGGVYPDGTFVLANSNDNFHCYAGSSDLFSRDTLLEVPSTGFTNVVAQAVTPTFSPDGRHVAFNFWQAKPGTDAGVAAGGGSSLAAMDFDCGAAAGDIACSAPPYSFSNLREIYRDGTRTAGWPGFTPDGTAVVFQSTITPSTAGSPLNTYSGGTAELMIADARNPPQFSPERLCALNGYQGDCMTPYLPVSPSHPNDTIYNYEPTVNPVPSGGYYWIVFTTRRAYGNVAQGDPYETNTYSPIDHPVTKKLWVAALDEHPAPGKDPSHPAFYLPGQELNAGDMRGYWVVEPCRPDGTACTTGDQCCNGFCRQPSNGAALVCTTTTTGCSNEFEKCVTAADCCGASQGSVCIDGRCAQPAAQ
jgi:WD40-like Beta Propeller Repeat